ncbi:sensor histidine kinase [Nocardioides sp.]|uniref:sensor histidine kinase n=1 Tax=Nocardioides sp. TaxID=35761 RepID=UPI00352836F2
MDFWRALWHESRPAHIPPRGPRDWALVAVLSVTALGEAIWRPDVAWRPVVTVVALVVVGLLPWRRERPLACLLAGFGLGMTLTTAQLVAGTADLGLYTMIVVLVLLYSLVRWGSGREIVVGLAFVAVAAAYGFSATTNGPGDLVGGIAVLLVAIADGAAFRYRADLWDRQLAEARSEERVGLARELHDTVAHHVSAIAVQAQAGRAVAATRPEAALQTLATIEQEASRTLAEMRAMVSVLRHGEDAEYAPQPGVADLLRLARPDARPRVEVRLRGDLVDLTPMVDTAIYRIAQESLTNALRHAGGATAVEIEVSGDPASVRLQVTDDGRLAAVAAEGGFGLVGMRERAELLGGRLTAGPSSRGGWVVRAELPRENVG